MKEDYFFFEEENYDIPFYRKNPELTGQYQTLLVTGLIIAVIAIFSIPVGQYLMPRALLIMLATLVPVLYTLRGHLDTIFRIPRKGDIPTVILGVLVYVALGILVSSTLTAMGVPVPINRSQSSDNPVLTIAAMTIQILGEELLKFIAFTMTMTCACRMTGRKNSIAAAVIMSQLLFALLHIRAYGLNLPYLLLSVALVSTVLPVIYLKTKNVTVTYLTHLLIDVMPVLLVTLLMPSVLV